MQIVLVRAKDGLCKNPILPQKIDVDWQSYSKYYSIEEIYIFLLFVNFLMLFLLLGLFKLIADLVAEVLAS